MVKISSVWLTLQAQFVILLNYHTDWASLSDTFLQTARSGYTTEGALFLSTQLSTNAVSTFQKIWVVIRLWRNISSKYVCKREVCPPQV